MVGPEQVEQLRTASTPLAGYWTGDNWEAPGSLYWEDGNPLLELFFHAEEDEMDGDVHRSQSPIVQALRPPQQPTITGSVKGFGAIALEGCACINTRRNSKADGTGVNYVLTIQPTIVWLGPPPGDEIGVVRLQDARLQGFFSSRVRTLDPYDNAVAFGLMGNPHRVMAIDTPARLNVNLGEEQWQVIVDTVTSQGFSATTGFNVQTAVSLKLLAPPGMSREAADRYVFELETILSTFSLEPFAFQYRSYAVTEMDSEVHLVWQLGQDSHLFTPPLRHQVLINFNDPATFTAVMEQWFKATGDTRLARWLFGRALRETTDGLARFVSVAQAFEVMARDRGRAKIMTSESMATALQRIEVTLSDGQFDQGFIDRTVQLVASSNRASFQDSLLDIIGGLVRCYGLGSEEEVKAFCQSVAATRNSVVHMTDKPKAQLNDAFGRVNKLGPQLCRWFAVQVATDLELEIPDLALFLYNNRVSRMGLPIPR